MNQKTITLLALLIAASSAHAQGADSPLSALLAKRGQESTKSQPSISAPATPIAQPDKQPSSAPGSKAQNQDLSQNKAVQTELVRKADAASHKLQPTNAKPNLGVSQAGGVNPVSGQDSSVEELDKVLSIKKKQTDIALEEAKRLKAEAEISSLSSRAAPAKPLLADQKAQQFDAAAATTSKSKKKGKGKDEPIAAPPPSGPNVLGVMMSKGEAVAMIEVGGQIAYLKQGESSGGFTVGAIGQNSVEIGGRNYSVGPQASRQTSVDRQGNGNIGTQPSSSGNLSRGTGNTAQGPLPSIQSVTSATSAIGFQASNTAQPVIFNAAPGTTSIPTAPPPPSN
jgi:hypothetical protein